MKKILLIALWMSLSAGNLQAQAGSLNPDGSGNPAPRGNDTETPTQNIRPNVVPTREEYLQNRLGPSELEKEVSGDVPKPKTKKAKKSKR